MRKSDETELIDEILPFYLGRIERDRRLWLEAFKIIRDQLNRPASRRRKRYVFDGVNMPSELIARIYEAKKAEFDQYADYLRAPKLDGVPLNNEEKEIAEISVRLSRAFPEAKLMDVDERLSVIQKLAACRRQKERPDHKTRLTIVKGEHHVKR